MENKCIIEIIYFFTGIRIGYIVNPFLANYSLIFIKY